MVRFINRFLQDGSGATAIEYGLIAVLVALVIAVGLTSMGGNINGMFGNVATQVSAK